jgi:hypothetical protein
MPTRLRLFPAFPNLETACDILNRIAWGLHGLDAEGVRLYVEGELEPAALASAWLQNPALSSSQENYLPGLPPLWSLPAGSHAVDADFDLYWDYLTYSASVSGQKNKILIDPNFRFDHEADQVAALQYTICLPGRQLEIRESSRRLYADFLAHWKAVGSAYLYLTGPTVETILQAPVDRNALHIICNSLVKNTALLEKLQPNVLMFSDPAYHFGVSKYASSFRGYVLQAMQAFPGLLCMVPERYYPLAAAFLGNKARGRLIGIPLLEVDRFHFPSVEEFYARKTGNILTSMMIPVASSAADSIRILGADGRASSDKGYWSHGKSSQIGDLLRTIYEAHPSLGRDENVGRYYQEHCQLLEALLAYGETAHNKAYLSLTPSLIPALANRMARPFSPDR